MLGLLKNGCSNNIRSRKRVENIFMHFCDGKRPQNWMKHFEKIYYTTEIYFFYHKFYSYRIYCTILDRKNMESNL